MLVQRIQLDKKKVGKLLVGDAMVGGMSWSADEALLAFVADAPAPEQKEAFDGQFRFREELGEKYVPRRRRGAFGWSLDGVEASRTRLRR